jgi:glycosyltransferase involved in cell wall biosynthesis
VSIEFDHQIVHHDAAGGSELEVTLETKLPRSLPASSGGAVFLYGTCGHRDGLLARLDVLVDGDQHPASAWNMQRSDLCRAAGFWATVALPPRPEARAIKLGLRARLSSGRELEAPLGRVELTPPEATDAGGSSAAPPEDLIAVCLATFEPDMELFRAQIESLRAQTDERWVCVVSDDCSDTAAFEALRGVLDGDERFRVSRSDERLGFYRNFERALTLAPSEAGLIALCDQDDRWYPDKLASLRRGLGPAQLVYSDLRLVDARGRVLRDTLWKRRRNNHTDLASLLVANTITGAATLFRRELAGRALPFPDPPGWQFHDHWLGLVALAAGDVAYVDRPLYDYVQHEGAILGHVSPRRRRSGSERPGLMTRWRAAYFYGYLGRVLSAHALLARCPDISPQKRRVLTRFIAAERSPRALVWLALRPLRAVAGANETLGSELQLALGVFWKRLASAGHRDAALPPLASFEQRRLRRWRGRV